MRAWLVGRTGTVLIVILAVVVASAATAGAASLITGKQIKNGTITAKDLSKKLREQVNEPGPTGATGPAGPAGPAGAAGATGLAGAPGEDGSPDSAEQVRDKLLTADGAGSGVDADTLDGKDAADFAANGAEAWHEIGTAGEPEMGYGGFQFRACVWANYGNDYDTAAFFRDASGMVHLKGVIVGPENNVSGATTCADAIAGAVPDLNSRQASFVRLPPGYRPAARTIFTTISNSKLARVDAWADGRVYPVPPTTGADVGAWLSLSGISFRCAPAGVDGCP